MTPSKLRDLLEVAKGELRVIETSLQAPRDGKYLSVADVIAVRTEVSEAIDSVDRAIEALDEVMM